MIYVYIHTYDLLKSFRQKCIIKKLHSQFLMRFKTLNKSLTVIIKIVIF